MLKAILKIPKMILKYIMKYPFLSGIAIFAIYACCSEQAISFVKDKVYSAADVLKAKKEDPESRDIKELEQQAPELIDPSMFNESLKYNATIATVDAKVEDVINDVHA